MTTITTNNFEFYVAEYERHFRATRIVKPGTETAARHRTLIGRLLSAVVEDLGVDGMWEVIHTGTERAKVETA